MKLITDSKEWQDKHVIAVKWNWGYENFKCFISQFLKRENDEDQWVFDYESYVEQIVPSNYEHPSIWAALYYGEDWDTNRARKSKNK